jgi:rhomboid protease GluP
MRHKIKLLFIPFLLINIAFSFIYSLLAWLFCLKLEILSFDKESEFLIPACLAFVPVLIWLRPKINFLNLADSGRRGGPKFGYHFFAGLLIAVSAIFSFRFIDSVTGAITTLPKISMLNNLQKTRYYKVKDFYSDTSKIGVQASFYVSGKTDSIFSYYFVIPLFDDANNAINSKTSTWMGFMFKKYVNISITSANVDSVFNSLWKETNHKTDIGDFNKFLCLERVRRSGGEYGLYVKAAKWSGKYQETSGAPVILNPLYIPVNQRWKSKIGLAAGIHALASLCWLILIWIPRLNYDPESVSEKEYLSTLNYRWYTDTTLYALIFVFGFLLIYAII